MPELAGANLRPPSHRGGSILVSTDAPDTPLTTDAPAKTPDLAPGHRQRQPAPAVRARRPRRPQRQGHQRRRRRVPAGPARLHPARQDDRHRPACRRAAAHRRRPGHRQDDDGPPDGPQRRLRRPGQRPVHLLRARRAVPAQPTDRDGVGARPPAAQDRRDQDPGRPQGDPRARGWPRARPTPRWPTTRACGRRWIASRATARTCS